MKQQALTVVGVMSGTSADGIDVAVTRIFPERKRPRLKLLAFAAFPFSKPLRPAVLRAMEGKPLTASEFARLATRLGIAYADAIEATLRESGNSADLIGCHGQTIYHQGVAEAYLGRRFATTWQLLDPSPIAERLRIPVVSDFRSADIAAGGQGAPLVPLLDYEFFRDAKEHRVLQNLGGIGNMTVLPAGVAAKSVIAFDTGPGNMVMDALMQRLYSRAFDGNGVVAARGTPLLPVIATIVRGRFFRESPPRTAGREQFGAKFADEFLAMCRRHSRRSEDAIATATLLTARAVRIALDKFARPRMHDGTIELILSGGGARNAALVQMIEQETKDIGCHVRLSDDLGLPGAAKEAVAFALLAWNMWHRLPGNLPSATGAKRAVVLGRISHV